MTFIYRQFARVFVGGLAAMALLAGCAADTSNQQKEAASASSDSPAAAITLLTPKAPSLIPAVYMENTAAAGTFKVATWDSLEQLLAGIQSDEAPLYAAPINAGACAERSAPATAGAGERGRRLSKSVAGGIRPGLAADGQARGRALLGRAAANRSRLDWRRSAGCPVLLRLLAKAAKAARAANTATGRAASHTFCCS